MRIALALAEKLALEVIGLYEGTTDGPIEIAGSIRRRREDVKDAELILRPKLVPDPFALIPEDAPPLNLQFERTEELIRQGVLQPRMQANRAQRIGVGPLESCLVYKGFAIDIFACAAAMQWGVLKLIRTGPSFFGKRVASSRLAYPGYGYMPGGMQLKDWSFIDLGNRLETPDEETAFQQLGFEYQEPTLRGLEDLTPIREVA